MSFPVHRLWARVAAAVAFAALMLAIDGSAPSSVRAATIPTVSIAQYPLTVAVPAHPQVLFVIPNSQSVDGTLSGAIMTGSGSIGGAIGTGLANSASPVNYTIPSGFTPPLNAGSGGVAPYSVYSGGYWWDNSPSRLNVAKQGVSAILNAYMEYADFALMDYSVGGSVMETSVYYMSGPGGFTFTNSPGASPYVNNPCYGANVLLTDQYDADCANLLGYYGVGSGIIAQPYMVLGNFPSPYNDTIGTTSDNPQINDVFYGGTTAVCIAYGTVSPASPYPPNYSLGQYENGGIFVGYSATRPNSGPGCPGATGPTNAGYVPYSPQVMYAVRGFGYCCDNASTAGGNLVVGMQTAGAIPTPGSVATAIAAFNTALQPESNNAGTGEIKADALQSPIAALIKGAKSYYQSTNPASNNGCTATRYVVLVTDGLPTEDLSGKNWPPLGTFSGSSLGYGVTATFNPDGSLNTTNDQAITDTITQLAALKAAGIKTYVIGLGAGVDPTVNPQASATLTAMAVAGGSGSYFPAYSPVDLTNDMQAILAQILAETAATSASAINSTGINTTSVAYQGTFTTSDVYEDWTGNLLAYPINPATGYINTAYSAALWQAQSQLDSQTWYSPGRLIATWDPVTSQGTPFHWNTSTTATSGIASSTALGMALETFTGDTNGQDVLEYLRGNSAKELRNGGQFRNRAHKLGDIVDSSPLYVGAPQGPWEDPTYFTFQATYAHREPMLYIGANDGMLHAFDAQTGHEVFAYIPHAVFNNLVQLVNPYYNPQHRFFVDSTPESADVKFSSDNSWHTMLFGSERAGGNSIFAIDVTDPSQFTNQDAVAQAVLWEFTDGNMGNTYSLPVAVNTAAGFAVMFGNGYNSPTSTPFLYALNPQTGAVMAKIDLCGAVPTACNTSLPNGLSSVAAMDTTGALLSGNPNVVYAGDLQGNLWRVDISNSNPANWTVSVLFQARDSSGNLQPITVTPVATLNPMIPRLTGAMVYFGTGQFLGLPDLGNTKVQSVYGIYDSGTPPSSPYTRANLVTQTITTQTSASTSSGTNTIRLLSSNAVNLPTVKGWYVDLYVANSSGTQLDPGERVVTDPALFNGTLQITTYQPNPNTCVGGGNAWYMVFNYATGGATTLQQFDWYGAGAINNHDLYMGQTVAGSSLGNSYAAAPKMVSMGPQAVVYTTTGAAELNGLCNGGSCDPNTLNAEGLARGSWQEIR